eukprot:SAG22_NODE_1604_length_4014_cov_2.392082_2_plen_176_part_00
MKELNYTVGLPHTVKYMGPAELEFWVSYYPMLSTNRIEVEQRQKLASLLERFAIHWSGFFLAKQTGGFVFEITANDKMEVVVDGLVLGTGGLGRFGDTFQGRADSVRPTRVSVHLTEGWHQIRARYYQNSGGMGAKLAYLPPNASHDVSWFHNITFGNEKLEILRELVPGRLLCA